MSESEGGDERASLVVLGLPRSLSTFVHRRARRALGLVEPAWAGAGEILNLDRSVLNGGPRFDENRKFLTPEQHPDDLAAVLALLDDVVAPTGKAYKDVVQPFAMAAWLADHPMPTLVLDRPLADVALAMLTNRWYYPAAAAWLSPDRDGAVIEGLVRAERALSTVAGERLAFDDLVYEEDALALALRRLYPGRSVELEPYRSSGWVAEGRRQVARRITPTYRALEARIDHARLLVDRGGPPPAPSPPVRPFSRASAESIRRRVCEVLPPDAFVGVADLGAAELAHLEGRRTRRLPAPAGGLLAAFDLALDQGMDHLLIARSPGAAREVEVELGGRLAGAADLHADDVMRLVRLVAVTPA